MSVPKSNRLLKNFSGRNGDEVSFCLVGALCWQGPPSLSWAEVAGAVVVSGRCALESDSVDVS